MHMQDEIKSLPLEDYDLVFQFFYFLVELVKHYFLNGVCEVHLTLESQIIFYLLIDTET